MPILQIFRDGSLFTEVTTGGSETVFNGSLGGMNKITSQFSTDTAIKFKKGDYVFHHGHSYYLKNLPKHTKDGSHTYEAVFVGREYTLYNFAFRYLNSASFTFYGTASEHLALILGVANVADPGWTGTAESTASFNIDYAKDSCRTAITKIAEAAKLELSFSGQSVALNAKNTGRVHDLTFTYGMNNGLYSMTKTELDESEFGTRFYGYGGSDNLPQNYRGGSLQLLPPTVFVDRKIGGAGGYGLIEKHVEFPEIFPERTGTVSATSSINEVTDSSLDFNLNDVIVDGSAKIIFTTGLLRNQEFEIATYADTTKVIKFNITQDDAGYKLPNTTLKPAIGDQYKLVGIVLPQSYITNAENRLLTALNTHADANQDPPFQFDLVIDPIFLAEKNYQYEINPGDMVQAVEPDMDVSVYLRVTDITYPLFEPYNIKATIGDKINYSLAVEVIKDITSTKQEIKQITKTSLELQRINSIRRRELQGAIFDPDNYFDTTNIRPGSIETSMLAVGTQSQDFSLSVMFKPNYNANPNAISWSAGQLVHFTIADTNKTWDIAPTIISNLVPTTLYYIYAKCAKNGFTGTIVLDTVQRRYNDDPTDYYFLIGVAHVVSNGVRALSLTYGFTDINGRFITTGRITSSDGLTWFDLDTGEISGVIKFRSANGSIQNVTVIETAATNAVTVASNADAKAVTANVTANSANTAAISAQGKADTAFTNAASAQTAATNAQSSATTANNLLADIANDDLLTPSEKQDILKEWNIIASEKSVINAQSFTYAVTTTAYDTAYNTLNSYVTPLLSSMTANSPIVGTTFRANFKAYYDAKVSLLKAISDKAKQIADAAQTSANTVAANLTALQASLGALAYDQLVFNAMQRETIIVGGYIKASLIQVDQIIVGGNLETIAGAQAKANAAQLAAVNAAAANTSSQIASIQSGSKNIIINSKAAFGAGVIDNTVLFQGAPTVKFPAHTSSQQGAYFVEPNKTYTYSAMVKSTVDSNSFANVPLHFHVRNQAQTDNGRYTSAANDEAITTAWKQIYFTFTTAADAYYFVPYIHDPANDLNVAWMKLEQGNQITDWSPAPEDIYNDSTTKANAAQAAAIAYATAQDNLKELTTRAYADGIVDTEEARAIADATAKLNEARADATAKADAAKAAADIVAWDYALLAYNNATTFADQVATSKANIAQAAAISSASTDAQNKANIAYSNAVSASNTYAETKANEASTAAQIAAAADASNKATAAYNNAVSAAQTQYSNLTASLKPLAFSDVQQIGSQSGITFINQGNIATFSIDAAYIRANVITAQYLQTEVLNAAYIQSLDVNFNKGKIGAWVIDSYGLTDSSGSAKILMSKASNSGGKTEVQLGLELTSGASPDVTFGSTYYASKFFATNQKSGSFNVAVYAEASGALTNKAGDFRGAVDVTGALSLYGNLYSTGSQSVKVKTVFNGYTLDGTDYVVMINSGGSSYQSINLPTENIEDGRVVIIANKIASGSNWAHLDIRWDGAVRTSVLNQSVKTFYRIGGAWISS